MASTAFLNKALLLLLICSLSACVQQQYHIAFCDDPVSTEDGAYSLTLLYEVRGHHVRTRKGEFRIKYPENFQASDTSFGTEFYTGYPGEISRGIGLLVADRKSGLPRIYVDLNNNLNFSDDGPPVSFFPRDTTAILVFRQRENPAISVRIQYSLPGYTPENAAYHNKLFGYKHLREDSIPMLSSAYSFMTRRLDNRLTRTTLAGDSVKIALSDANFNGYYNNTGVDRIFVAPVEATFHLRRNSGTFDWQGGDEQTLFQYRDQLYEVTRVDSLGRCMEIKSSKAAYDPPIGPGQRLPDLTVQLVNGDSISLHELLNGEQYLLLNAWGNWCVGCHASAQSLRELAEKYHGQLRILGLNSGEPRDKVESFLHKYDHSWPQAYSHASLLKTLRIEAYPTYILIDPAGRIVSFPFQPDEVDDALSQASLSR